MGAMHKDLQLILLVVVYFMLNLLDEVVEESSHA